jgi:hypothetical protein
MNKRNHEGNFSGWKNPAKRMKFGNYQHTKNFQPQRHQNSTNQNQTIRVVPFKHKNSQSFQAINTLRKLRENVTFNLEQTFVGEYEKFAIISVVVSCFL